MEISEPRARSAGNGTAIVHALPGVALWITWIFAPIPDGPGGGVILVPFLGCLVVAALFLTALTMASSASRWARWFTVATNLSFPLFLLFSFVA